MIEIHHPSCTSWLRVRVMDKTPEMLDIYIVKVRRGETHIVDNEWLRLSRSDFLPPKIKFKVK